MYNYEGVQKVLSLFERWMSIHLFFNIITAFVNAQPIAISEFFDSCKIEKFWLLLQPLVTWHQVITISTQLNFISDKQ